MKLLEDVNPYDSPSHYSKIQGIIEKVREEEEEYMEEVKAKEEL